MIPLEDEMILDAYYRAFESKLDEDFLEILKNELKSRDIDVKPKALLIDQK